MYCPTCKRVYQEGLTLCSDCGTELQDGMPEMDSVRLEAMKPVKLTTVIHNYDAGIILNLLHNNCIPCLKKDKFTGGYMNLLMGYSVYGQDIYVDEKDYERALELIKILEPTKALEDNADTSTPVTNGSSDHEAFEQDTVDEDNSVYPAFYRNPSIVARIILGFMVAGAIIGIIIGTINS